MLIDRILKQFSVQLRKKEGLGPKGEFLRSSLLEAQVFLVQNVCQYLYEETEQEEFSMEGFPNLAPPFPTMFFEWGRPRYSRSTETGFRTADQAFGDIQRMGALMLASDVTAQMVQDTTSLHMLYGLMMRIKLCDDEGWRRLVAAFGREPRAEEVASAIVGRGGSAALGQIVQELKDKTCEGIEKTDLRWNIALYTFLETKRREITCLPYIEGWGLRGDGTFLSGTYTEAIFDPSLQAQQQTFSLGVHLVPCMATSFMHCKNVSDITVSPSERQNRARIKDGKDPLVSYQVLEIHPMRQVLREEGDVEAQGLRKALHICRGHFKDYQRGSGLFGKAHGLYWWESHVRGALSQGIAAKDYRVHSE